MQPSTVDWKNIFSEGGIDAVVTKKNELDNEWKTLPVVIAVVGQTGSGKSTLIRRMLSYQPRDSNGPAIGQAVNECTKEAAQYKKEGTGLLYIDLPGVNSSTTTNDINTPEQIKAYSERFRLHTVDYFLLVSQNKFNAQEKILAKYITKELKKKFLFVQTKMDSLRNEDGNKFLEEDEGFDAVKNLIRNQIQNQLGFPTSERIFLISNGTFKVSLDNEPCWVYDNSPEYEFDGLIKRIHNDMAGTDGLAKLKVDAFILSTGNICESAIRAIANTLRQQSTKWPAIAATIGLVPIPGVSLLCDSGIIIGVAINYFEMFGMKPEDFIKGDTKSEQMTNLINLIGASMGVRAAAILSTAIGLSILEEGVKAIPIIGFVLGSVLGAVTSYISVEIVLNRLIDFCEKEALLLMRNKRTIDKSKRS